MTQLFRTGVWIFCLLLLCLPGAAAQQKGQQEIKFSAKAYKATLATARAAHKNVFVDAFATWCAPCKALRESTFRNPEAARYFNKYFVNISIDVEKDEGVELARTWQIEGLPTLLIIDGNGQVLAHHTGFVDAAGLMEFAREATGKTDTATFASGCFWCGEAKFSQLKGVLQVTSGYTGGHVANPGYEEVCTGTTGHAEAFNVVFDTTVISYDELLEAFFLSHDPTQLNRQGNDIGTQYRSAIFYHNSRQKEKATYYIRELTDQKIYPGPIVTEVTRFTVFYDAESYHQEYFKNHPDQAYCRYVIQPQLEKFKHIFKEKIRQ